MRGYLSDMAYELGQAAAAAHGFLACQPFDPIHDEQAKRIVNEIAELLWPGDESMKWKERENG